MSISLYEYSQLACITQTLTLGATLLFIGNAKVKESPWLKWAKWTIALVFLAVGAITLLQYAFKLSVSNSMVDNALNMTAVYMATILLGTIFFPLANDNYLTTKRLLTTLALFLLATALIWIATLCEEPLSQILTVVSLAIYFIELLRIIYAFRYNYKKAQRQEGEVGSEKYTRSSYLKIVINSVMLLACLALLYIFLLFLPNFGKAIFNFVVLIAFGYLYVSFNNLIINYNPLIDINLPIKPSSAKPAPKTQHTSTHPQLSRKIDTWVAKRSYCRPGVTLMQLAQEMGTNRSYMSQYINSRFGCTFNEWLMRLRIDEAKRLLASSPTLSLDKLSVQVGFSSKSHFIKSFKAVEGITPGQWRETNG